MSPEDTRQIQVISQAVAADAISQANVDMTNISTQAIQSSRPAPSNGDMNKQGDL